MKSVVICLLLVSSAVFADEPRWTFADGKEVRLESTSEAKQLVDSGGSVLLVFPAADEMSGAILSEGRTCLLLLVQVERLAERRPNRRSFDYGYLLRISWGPTGWQVKRLLDHASPPMNVLHRTISELGAVADDGKIALLKFGEANKQIAPYTMNRVWQTWDLETPKLLRAGLKLENGIR